MELALLRRSREYPVGYELALVNLIRERLDAWRQGYAGVTCTTLELLQWWRREGRENRLFYAQMESERSAQLPGEPLLRCPHRWTEARDYHQPRSRPILRGSWSVARRRAPRSNPHNHGSTGKSQYCALRAAAVKLALQTSPTDPNSPSNTISFACKRREAVVIPNKVMMDRRGFIAATGNRWSLPGQSPRSCIWAKPI